MYSIAAYGEMIRDAVRMDAYARALRRSIGPESVVLDIGTGTGIFALLACKLGARRVFAIDPSEAISVSREIAAVNGCEGTIEFIQGMSTEVTLPEKATVLVSDLRGVLPLWQRHLEAIADARARLLEPGATLIPQCDRIWAAVVEAPSEHREVTSPWIDNPYGLDMRAASQAIANSYWRTVLRPGDLITAAQCLGTLDYRTRSDPDFLTQASLLAEREGIGHGLGVWFDSELAEGIEFSNAPGEQATVYGNAFFPWPRPVALRLGHCVDVKLRADLVGDQYVWGWQTTISAPDEAPVVFRQSEFFGEPLSAARLKVQAAEHRAHLGEEGQVDAMIMGLMREERTLGEIAREVAARYPGRFEDWHDALRRVGRLSSRYGC